MRKLLRNMMRGQAKKAKVTASKFVTKEWDRYQIKKVGVIKRKINKTKGTYKKRTWNLRIQGALS